MRQRIEAYGGAVESEDVGRLVEGLAAAAVAGLVGNPLPAVAVTAAVPFLSSRLQRHSQSREQVRQVSDAVTAWARSENLGGDRAVGLRIATVTILKHGLSTEAFKALDYDKDRGTAEIIRRARVTDWYSWAATNNAYEDDGHVVARKAIRATLAAMASSDHRIEATVLAALREEFRDVRTRCAKTAAGVQDVQEDVQALVQHLTDVGSAVDVMSYLRARIKDWDVSVWHPGQQTPSVIERKLRVLKTVQGSFPHADVVSAEEALEGQKKLVVLGGPGSGKSWLARRYVRQAAQTALELLEGGADLNAAELPLLTTWDRWTKTNGPLRQSLVDASFESGSGHSDVGAVDDVRRLQRTFTRDEARVLVVVDSLDEAADLSRQTDRLYELESLPVGWRVVVTSRPAAWHTTQGDTTEQEDGVRVVEVKDMVYPDDVNAFITAWFAGDPSRGQSLIEQIRARTDLRRIATVPLILTFYCLLTETSTEPGWQLPARRRELYQRLVRRLLLGTWAPSAPGPDAEPDIAYCEELLAEWAWEAVRSRGTASGFGNWGDTFKEPTRARQSERRAVDHVAPKEKRCGEGGVERRFVHRTILEHFVAEHIATMKTSKAARILLPHLFFDTDWEVAAPATIAAHNRKRRGKLLTRILSHADHLATDPRMQRATSQLDGLLLAIARESEPHEWTHQHQAAFHECRIRNATDHRASVGASAHWTASNAGARAEVMKKLVSAYPSAIRELVGVLPSLEPTDVDRAEARALVLVALPSAESGDFGGLVDALTVLVTTEAERAGTRAVLLTALSFVRPWGIRRLVNVIIALDPTDDERAAARAVVLTALPSVEPYSHVVRELVGALPALVITEAERAQARAGVLATLPSASVWVIGGLVNVLSVLDSTAVERAAARTVVLTALASARPAVVRELVVELLALGPTKAERAESRTVVLAALSCTDPAVVRGLLDVLPALDPQDAERARQRDLQAR